MKTALTLVLTGSLFFASRLCAEGVFTEGVPVLASSSVTLPSFSDLVREVGPAVVNITVESDVKDQAIELPDGAPPLRGNGRPITSLGSGFVISSDGFIVTNNHVVEKAGKIIVRLGDNKTEFTAQVIGKDEKTDVALIKIESPTPLKTVLLGDSDKLDVGDWVLAIGNQFQLGQTVTQGIVSATSRKVPRGGPYDDFIQTDASINPGSSGGPLFNLQGQVVGINTAIFSPARSSLGGTGFNIGIGFATPINIAKSILIQLKESGKVTRGWLGVLIQKVTADVAFAMQLPSYDGALVGHVIADSPAAKSGFEHGDVIVEFDGRAVRENDELPLLVANTPINKKVDVKVVRKGKEKILPVTIEELKQQAKPQEEKRKVDELGLELETLSPMIARFLGIEKEKGVHILNVDQGSKAEEAGLARGDVILGIVSKEKGQKDVSTVEEFHTALSEVSPKDPLLVFVLRSDRGSPTGSSSLYLVLKR